MIPEEILQDVAAQVKTCTRCKLYRSRKNAVPGSGSAETSIMFIGEGPGFHENEQGLPFVGAAGQFLDELLAAAGLRREDVFITNVVKCRPPGNRDPQPDELEACKVFLDRQIAAINPDVIVTLGRISMGKYIANGKISSIHGQTFWVNERMIIPMYHPAAALHQPSLQGVVKDDFARLPDLIAKAQEARGKHQQEEAANLAEVEEEPVEDQTPKQLSLF